MDHDKQPPADREAIIQAVRLLIANGLVVETIGEDGIPRYHRTEAGDLIAAKNGAEHDLPTG